MITLNVSSLKNNLTPHGAGENKMAYVTEDKEVKKILRKYKDGLLKKDDAAAQIKALDFLDWEVKEAFGDKW